MKIEASTQAFNARHIAKAKVCHLNKHINYDVFELSPKDYPILPKIWKSIDLKKIVPNINRYDYSIWQSIVTMVLTPPESEHVKTLLQQTFEGLTI